MVYYSYGTDAIVTQLGTSAWMANKQIWISYLLLIKSIICVFFWDSQGMKSHFCYEPWPCTWAHICPTATQSKIKFDFLNFFFNFYFISFVTTNLGSNLFSALYYDMLIILGYVDHLENVYLGADPDRID